VVRGNAYGTQISLERGITICQFENLTSRGRRDCVDCIGHAWTKTSANRRWQCTVDQGHSLASGTSCDGESGFIQATPSQLRRLVQNVLAKVAEIEEQMASDGDCVVACHHGSNRSFWLVNLYFQKQHDVGYETIRQLMTKPRGGRNGPVHHTSSQMEPAEYLKDVFCHVSRAPVAVSTRYSHARRWEPVGLDYKSLLAYMHQDGETDEDDDSDDSGGLSDCDFDVDKADDGSEEDMGYEESDALAAALGSTTLAGTTAGKIGRGGGQRGKTRGPYSKGGKQPAANLVDTPAGATPVPGPEPASEPEPEPESKKLRQSKTGLMQKAKGALVRIIGAMLKVKSLSFVPAALRKFKRRSGQTQGERRECEAIKDYYLARYEGDHER
jgi:hypothetical protein